MSELDWAEETEIRQEPAAQVGEEDNFTHELRAVACALMGGGGVVFPIKLCIDAIVKFQEVDWNFFLQCRSDGTRIFVGSVVKITFYLL